MADNMRIYLELIGRSGQLRSELTNSKNAVTGFTQGVKREFSALRGTFSSLQGQLAAVGVSVGVLKTMADSARLDKSLTQIGQTAGEGSARVNALRDDLFRMGRESGQSIEGLRDGFNSLVQSGLNMDESKSTLEGINVAMAVTGANAEVLSAGLGVSATAFNFDLAKPGQALELLDKMTVAGRKGNAELQNLSDIFARVGVNASSGGLGFEKTLAFIEGLSLVERQPERLATLADSTLRLFTNAAYMKTAMKATGVKFFNDNGGRRDPLAIIKDIKKQYDALKTDKDRARFEARLTKGMDQDTAKGLRTFLKSDMIRVVESFERGIKNAGGTLKRDFSAATRNLIDQAGMLKNDLRKAADVFVKPINETLGLMIQWARDSKENGGLGLDGKDMIIGGAAGTIATLVAAHFGGRALPAIAKSLLKNGSSLAAGVAEGKVLQAATGVTPVFVTNMPGGGINPAGAGGSSVSTVAGSAPMLPVIAGGALAAATLYGVWDSVSLMYKQFSGAKMSKEEQIRAFNYASIPEAISMYEQGREPPKNEIHMNITVDQGGKVSSSSDDPNTKIRIKTMRRGSFFEPDLF